MSDFKDMFDDTAQRFMTWLKKPDNSGPQLRSIGIHLLNIGVWSAIWWQCGKLDRTYDKLDSDKSVLFTSVSDCVSQNYKLADCQCSWEQAKQVAENVSFKYVSEDDAARHHQNYGEVTYTKRNYLTGKTSSYNRYEPLMTGWQANFHNINDGNSVPVYSGPEPNTHVRSDGRLINCACPTSP